MRQKPCSHRRRSDVLAFIRSFSARNGYSPTYREIGDAVGIRSVSTVSRYVHELIEAGEISCDESKPRTISPIVRDNAFETVERRFCLEIADGGKIYLDCSLEKPKAASVRISFDGILDAESLKGRVGQVIRCRAEQ